MNSKFLGSTEVAGEEQEGLGHKAATAGQEEELAQRKS